MRLLFKYTSRSRPSNFFRGLNSIVNNLADKDNYWVQGTFDLSDETMFNVDVISRLNEYKNISYYFGESKNKIDAINKNLDKLPPFDILINMSDDFIFTQQGFDSLISEYMQKHFPDTDGFLHFHDGNQNRLATMNIAGKKYFQRTNYIYHPDYISLYSDNEEQDKAKILGKYAYMGDDCRIMMHIHPLHGHGKELMDAQYQYTESFYDVDRATYLRHKANNFGLK
jgi:hypothetical protein